MWRCWKNTAGNILLSQHLSNAASSSQQPSAAAETACKAAFLAHASKQAKTQNGRQLRHCLCIIQVGIRMAP